MLITLIGLHRSLAGYQSFAWGRKEKDSQGVARSIRICLRCGSREKLRSLEERKAAALRKSRGLMITSAGRTSVKKRVTYYIEMQYIVSLVFPGNDSVYCSSRATGIIASSQLCYILTH